jgi:hypothetical protein
MSISVFLKQFYENCCKSENKELKIFATNFIYNKAKSIGVTWDFFPEISAYYALDVEKELVNILIQEIEFKENAK